MKCRCLSSLFLNELSDCAVTMISGRLFHRLERILQRENFLKNHNDNDWQFLVNYLEWEPVLKKRIFGVILRVIFYMFLSCRLSKQVVPLSIISGRFSGYLHNQVIDLKRVPGHPNFYWVPRITTLLVGLLKVKDIIPFNDGNVSLNCAVRN